MSRMPSRRSSNHNNNGRRRAHHPRQKNGGGKLPQHAKSSLYKTELCRQYSISASCSYGSRCQFAHGEKDLRRRSSRHPKYKTQKCKAYWNQGFCPYGSRCMFLHDEDDKGGNNDAIPNLSRDMKNLSVFGENESSKQFGNRPRSASNRTLSVGSDEASKALSSVDATTCPVVTDLPPLGNFVARKGSFGGESSASVSSAHSYASSTRRFSSFDLYESVTPKTLDGSESEATFNDNSNETLKRWPSDTASVVSPSSPLDDPAIVTSATTATATESNAVDDSGSRLPFFKRLRSKTSPLKVEDVVTSDVQHV